jgi:2-isopropylmalate synthase
MADTQVRILAATVRQGGQPPGFSLRPVEKLQVAQRLARLGADVIEAGFAVASAADAETIRRIALALAQEGDRLTQVYRSLMTIADEQKVSADSDGQAAEASVHEAGYGHGV